jgi:hypothetical protein
MELPNEAVLIRWRRDRAFAVLRVHSSVNHRIASATRTTHPPQNISFETEHVVPVHATCGPVLDAPWWPAGLGRGGIGRGGGGAGFALHQGSCRLWRVHQSCAWLRIVAIFPPQSCTAFAADEVSTGQRSDPFSSRLMCV